MSLVVLSVVIPAYNEENTIEKVVREHVQVLSLSTGLVQDWELICLDDASTDETFPILSCLAHQINKMRVVRHEKNQGIYESFTHLFREARGTHIYQTASD